MYHHYLGPDYYSFTRGGVHFVGLNTVDIDDQQYYGHVDSLQLAWLERDLALVPAAMPIVTFDHIPFFTTFELINGYNDRPPAPSLITVQRQDGVPPQRIQRARSARRPAQASSRARARRAHARHGAHRVRDDRREDAVQSGFGCRRQRRRGRARVDLRGDAVSREERRDRCGSVHSARATEIVDTPGRLTLRFQRLPWAFQSTVSVLGQTRATVAAQSRGRSFARVLSQSAHVQLLRSTPAILLATVVLATPAASQQRGAHARGDALRSRSHLGASRPRRRRLRPRAPNGRHPVRDPERRQGTARHGGVALPAPSAASRSARASDRSSRAASRRASSFAAATSSPRGESPTAST